MVKRGYLMFFSHDEDSCEPKIVNIYKRRSDAVQALAGWKRYWQAVNGAEVLSHADDWVGVKLAGARFSQMFRKIEDGDFS